MALIFCIEMTAGVYLDSAACWQWKQHPHVNPLFSPTSVGLLRHGGRLTFLLSGGEHHTNRSSSTLWEPFLLFTTNNIKVMTAMSNAQERHKSASHFLIQLHCEKTSRVAQFKGRFSDFISNSLPFVGPSWRLHNTQNTFLFYFTSSTWKTRRGGFKVFGVILETKVNLKMPFSSLMPTRWGQFGCY